MSMVITSENSTVERREILNDAQKQRVEELVSKMTLTEKIGQLNQISPSIVGGFEVPFEELVEMVTDGRVSHEEFERIMSSAKQDYHEDMIEAGQVGAVMVSGAALFNRLQKIAVEKSRLGIPLITGFDVIHGFRTAFPIPLAESCSFDEEVFERTGRIEAKEARACGIQWAFSPMLDIARDARWGRISEGAGQDPLLGAVFARARVRGMQGERDAENHIDGEHLAACLKHFAAYGAAESGQDYNTVSMARSLLFNIYLPAFRAGAEAGALTVMAAFNDLNGVPCTVNSFLLRDVLKKQYGFKGFVVSDANAIKECISHGIAEDLKDAAKQAVNAGMDMDMGSGAFSGSLEELVRSGEVKEETLDEAVRRILTVKTALGLFEHPYASEEEAAGYGELPAEHRAAALDSAERSIVLLKNEGDILPLGKDKKIALVGDLADDGENMLGAWSALGRGSESVTILEGMQARSSRVRYADCGGPEKCFDEQKFSACAEGADVIVVCAGELNKHSGEASSRADITLPGEQRKMIEAALGTGKPVVLVLCNGRPLALGWEAGRVPAILETWQLGSEAGNAVAAVLFGEYAPSGRLSVTIPSVTGQCPRYYNHPSTGRPGSRSKFTSRYLDAPVEALYPFGFGLSYTSFAYSDFEMSEEGDTLTASVTVGNTGKTAGEETVQLYMRDCVASIVRPVKELKAFAKVRLEPGESRKVTLRLRKADMGFYDDVMDYHLEDGTFEFYVGGDSENCLKVTREVFFRQ